MSRRTRAVAVAVKACRLIAGSFAAELSQLPILRTKIMSPLADAVRFVDGDKADRPGRDERQERRRSPSPTSRSGATYNRR